MQTKIFNKLLWEMRPLILPVTVKQSDRVLNALVRYPPAEGTEIPQIPHQDHVDNF